jgi:hypothetical protein
MAELLNSTEAQFADVCRVSKRVIEEYAELNLNANPPVTVDGCDRLINFTRQMDRRIIDHLNTFVSDCGISPDTFPSAGRPTQRPSDLAMYKALNVRPEVQQEILTTRIAWYDLRQKFEGIKTKLSPNQARGLNI